MAKTFIASLDDSEKYNDSGLGESLVRSVSLTELDPLIFNEHNKKYELEKGKFLIEIFFTQSHSQK